MTDPASHENADRANDTFDAESAESAESADAEGYDQADRESVEGADPDLTVPGASDTAESGGQGADDRYVEGDLGGGAIGASIDEDEREGDEP